MPVRTAERKTDLTAVLEIWKEAGPGIQLSPSDHPEELAKKLERDPDLFLVYEEHGEILGAVLGGFDGRRGLMYHLAVPAGQRRKGIGKALMLELEARLRQKGCLKYYLLVTPDNAAALSFYETMGCVPMDLRVLGKEIECA